MNMNSTTKNNVVSTHECYRLRCTGRLCKTLCFLQKHKQEVLAVVDKSRQAEQRRRVDEGVKKRRKQEEEGRVHEAMRASLSEGWSLLLRLLDRRREVLRLASHFYQRLLEVPTARFSLRCYNMC